MSVRDAIVGILTLGPAYGHQILFEIHTRLPHRASVNPGQIYATLNRLAASNLIESAGVTSSQFTLYRLSDMGREHATSWLTGNRDVDVSDWSEILDVVTLASTLATIRTADTCRAISAQVSSWRDDARDTSQPRENLFFESRQRHAEAVTAWLDTVVSHVSSAHHQTWGYTAERPGRGRRPNSVE